MPWLMTLAPTNEAFRRENHAKKTLIRNLNTAKIWVVMQDAGIVLLSKKHKIL
jgi:hypothetical protein